MYAHSTAGSMVILRQVVSQTVSSSLVLMLHSKRFYQNEKEGIFFALDTAIKHNNKKEIKLIIKKLMFYYPKENALWKYKIYSKAPLPVFKFIKKLFAY